MTIFAELLFAEFVQNDNQFLKKISGVLGNEIESYKDKISLSLILTENDPKLIVSFDNMFCGHIWERDNKFFYQTWYAIANDETPSFKEDSDQILNLYKSIIDTIDYGMQEYALERLSAHHNDVRIKKYEPSKHEHSKVLEVFLAGPSPFATIYLVENYLLTEIENCESAIVSDNFIELTDIIGDFIPKQTNKKPLLKLIVNNPQIKNSTDQLN